MTTENTPLTEDEVYSLIITGDLSRSASLNIIRSYGNRKAIEALEQAGKSIPSAMRDEEKIDLTISSCIEKLDSIVRLSIEAIGEIN
jgi:hypothetical protein